MKNNTLLMAFITTALALSGYSAASTLTIAMSVDIPGFDTQNSNTTASETVYTNMFDRLVFADDKGKLQPALAASWKRINDTTTQFNLRKGVTFHNGDDFTAADVKYTIERGATDTKLFVNDTLKNIKTVKILNDYTVQIITAAPDPVLLNRLSRRGAEILPSKYINKIGGMVEFNKNPIGTGAFKFVSWKRDDRVTLEANMDYWRGKPAWNQLVIRAIPEESTRVNELITGGVDIAVDIPSQDIKRIQSSGKAVVASQPTSRVMMFAFNTDKDSATSSDKLREAIDMLIDRKLLIETVMGGYGTPVTARVTPGVTDAPQQYYNKDAYNPKRAAQLLKDADIKPGTTITLQGPKGRYPQDAEVVQAVAAMLQAAGLNTKVETMEWSAYDSRVWSAGKVVNMGLIGVANSMMDGWFALRTLPCKGSYNNITHWCNSQFDDSLNQAATSLNHAKRSTLIRDAYGIVSKERPMISLFQVNSLVGIGKKVIYDPRPDEVMWMFEAKPSGN